MTPEEKNLLNEFLSRLTQAGPVQADAEAAMMIAHAGERQPAALYLSVQRAVWLEQALAQAEARIRSLEAARQPATPAAGAGAPWLSSAWGSGADNGRLGLPPAAAAMAAPRPYPGGSGPAAYPTAAYPTQAGPLGGLFGGQGSMPMGAAPGFLGGGGSFLATAAATAAGVAVGAMVADAFEGHHRTGHGLADVPAPAAASNALVDTPDLANVGDFDGGQGLAAAPGNDDGPYDDGTDT